jgi:hypothetical protein
MAEPPVDVPGRPHEIPPPPPFGKGGDGGICSIVGVILELDA